MKCDICNKEGELMTAHRDYFEQGLSAGSYVYFCKDCEGRKEEIDILLENKLNEAIIKERDRQKVATWDFKTAVEDTLKEKYGNAEIKVISISNVR